jgi:hypothetical protein
VRSEIAIFAARDQEAEVMRRAVKSCSDGCRSTVSISGPCAVVEYLAWANISSKSSPTGAFLAAETPIAVLRGFQVRRTRVLRRMLYDRDQGQAVSPDRSAVPSSWVPSMDGLAGVSSERDTAPRSNHGRRRDVV